MPDRAFTFGIVAQAQAQADLAVLSARGRRVLRVHLGADPGRGLGTLACATREALAA